MYVASVKKVILQKIIVGISKNFVGLINKNAVCRDQNAVGLNQNARLVTFTIAENQNDYGLWPWRSAYCCFCNFALQQNMVLYFDKIVLTRLIPFLSFLETLSFINVKLQPKFIDLTL